MGRTMRPGREGSHAVKSSMGQQGLLKHYQQNNFFGGDLIASKRGNSQKGERSAKMPTAVLETWINETLEDAEHLDIPGVIMKSEHKEPIMRYGVSRRTLTEAGLSDGLVDRIYRALFVYSVGFYELLNKTLAHTPKKFTVVTALWKVYAVLLEYCNRSEYKMLIQQISEEHQDALEAMQKKYQEQYEIQAQNEKTLKDNMLTL